MAPPGLLPGEIEASVLRIRDIEVKNEKPKTFDPTAFSAFADEYLEGLRPGTFLLCTAEEEGELARHSPSRRNDSVDFDHLSSFETQGRSSDHNEEDLFSDSMSLNDDLHQDEDEIPKGIELDRKILVDGEIYHFADYL
ncbi:hypothetical protein PV08_09330 [Exophiala spinifera]|uniref:Uncharacterized protein n=1 Tax=Exophiala spinifera TaxID=91928 RepID=A0A0D1YAX3_9EURO|nr:uncharacterized protein PV08_09330 [Exophiala spinifera]KIW12056.1 hypothetical protein PV08_09330 [Exophiala spinifera]